MKHDFHERKERRIANAQDKAAKNRSMSEQQFNTANHIASVTQGEPIKVGHHSEARHQRDLEKMDNAMHSGIELDKKADYYQDKAAAIENNRAISSDDPDALQKLRDKLEKLVTRQELMKTVNKIIKKGDKEAFLALPGGTEKLWEQYNKGDSWGRKGFPAYELTNNNGNINRIRKRIAEMEKTTSRSTNEQTIKGVQWVENVQANRVQLIFPHKPSDEVRTRLKKTHGFKWAQSEGAWQRFLNNEGIYQAKAFLEWYTQE